MFLFDYRSVLLWAWFWTYWEPKPLDKAHTSLISEVEWKNHCCRKCSSQSGEMFHLDVSTDMSCYPTRTLLVGEKWRLSSPVYINCQLVSRKQQYIGEFFLDNCICSYWMKLLIQASSETIKKIFLTLCSIWVNIFHSYKMRVKCDATRHSVFLSWSQSTALWILQLLIADTTICIRRTQCLRCPWKWLRFKN